MNEEKSPFGELPIQKKYSVTDYYRGNLNPSDEQRKKYSVFEFQEKDINTLSKQTVFELIEKTKQQIPKPYELALGIKQAEHILNEVFNGNGFKVKIYSDMPLDLAIIK